MTERPTIAATPAKGLEVNGGAVSARAAAGFTVCVWAAAFPLIKIALAQVAPLELAAARFAIASALVLLWLAWKRPARPANSELWRFTLCGLVGIAIYNGLLNIGQRSVSASAASFIVNTVPIITALIATLFLSERFTRWGWAGAALGFGGVAIIIAGQGGGFAFGSGAVLIFGAAIAQASFFVMQRSLVLRYGALTTTAYTILAGTLLLTPWLADGVVALADPKTSPSVVISVVALGVFPAALGYAAWAYALGHYGAARASIFLYLVPPVATILAIGATAELASLATLAGGAIAICGVALVNARGRVSPGMPPKQQQRESA